MRHLENQERIKNQVKMRHFELDKRVSEQVIGNLPTDRVKPASPCYSTGIDVFGPYRIRDKVKKRTTSKTYGVIFTCLGKRAVYLDITADYDTDKFLMVLTRFVSLHGYYPSKLFSDNGTLLVSANKSSLTSPRIGIGTN